MKSTDESSPLPPQPALSPSWASLRAALRQRPDRPDLLDPAEARTAAQHVRPYVYETLDAKAMHFSLCEIQSRMQIQDPDALDLEYTRTMMGVLLFHPAPRDIVMIGLGGGSLAKFCFRHLPHSRVHVVEINPHVIALRDEFRVPPDGERFTVTRGDGARFVRRGGVRPDVLMVDGFDAQGQPARLCTQRFYDACADMLQPGGLLVANLHAGHPGHDAQVERLRRSFDDAVLVVEDAEPSNSIVFARSRQGLEATRPLAAARPAKLDTEAAAQLQGAFARVEAAFAARGDAFAAPHRA